MTATPLAEVGRAEARARLATRAEAPLAPDVESLASLTQADAPAGAARRLAIYAAAAGYDLVDELDHLATRSIEPNIFFNPRFLVPAMPRLEDRDIRLGVVRDDAKGRSRLRLIVPFSLERPLFGFAPPFLRTWSNPFGPLGTPLVDRDDPHGVLSDFLAMLAEPALRLPGVFVFPDIRLDGAFAAALRSAASDANLPLLSVNAQERAVLASSLDPEIYLKESLRRHHYREYRRLERRLGEQGALREAVTETPQETRAAVEHFLSLEVSGWKGRAGTAMVVDRFQAAFLREAVAGLAERGLCRVHTLLLDERPIAALIVFVEAGVAYTWKTAYDETLAAYSPGVLLMLSATRQHLENANIAMTDSCAVPDHPVMTRLWRERTPMATLVLGLSPGSDRSAQQTARALEREVRARAVARRLRGKLRRLSRR